MAEAILCGMLEHKLVRPGQITVTNHEDRFRLDELVYNFGIIANPAEKYTSIHEADILIFAMKPKNVKSAVEEIREHLRDEQLILSVVAGISTDLISFLLQTPQPVIRTMPNTSAIVGFSSTGMCLGKHVEQKHVDIATQIFESIGKVFITEEEHLDAVTGLSGSGPAYFYYMVEALIKGGVDAGLSDGVAKDLTYQTIMGAAHMLHETGRNPTELREKVTSPNGTTEKGLQTLESYRFEEAIRRCVYDATLRSKQLRDIMSSELKS